MSSQVIRVSSGDTIQVRTGVIQGIGPQGPTGPTGPRGETGPQGAQGVPGPTGYVTSFSSYFQATAQGIATTTVTSNMPTTWSLMAFQTVVRDEVAAQTSTTNYDLAPGDYQGFVYVQFQKQASVSATGFRAVQVTYAGTVIAEAIHNAVSLVHTDITLPFSLRSANASDVINIKVAHNEGVSINVLGNLWFNKTGPGAQGPAGPQGIQGPIGPQGVQGPIGPAGSVANNTTTFATLGGDDL